MDKMYRSERDGIKGKPPLMVDPFPGIPMKPPKPKPDPRKNAGITGPGGRSVDKFYNTY